MIRIGIGGWNFAPWRGVYCPDMLPQRRELEYASRQLTSIEVNATYYGSQKPESFQKWHDETPEDIVFAVKGPRFAISRRILADAGGSMGRFLDSDVTRLGTGPGLINWQLAETTSFNLQDFVAFLTLLPDSHDGLTLRHAIEARHASFDRMRQRSFSAPETSHWFAQATAGPSRSMPKQPISPIGD